MSNNTIYPDKHLFSPRRLWNALCMWYWWVAVCKLDMPFWRFIWYHDRPHASHKDGVY